MGLEPLQSGDVLELLQVGGRWIVGVFWTPGDHPVPGLVDGSGWHGGEGLGPSLRVPLAVPSEEHAGRDGWPDDEGDFRPYAALVLRNGSVMRWSEPRRNLYSGPR